MAQMKLDRPYMELHTGEDGNFGGYPIFNPSGSTAPDIFVRMDGLSIQLTRVESLVESVLRELGRPWYVRLWQWIVRIFRS